MFQSGASPERSHSFLSHACRVSVQARIFCRSALFTVLTGIADEIAASGSLEKLALVEICDSTKLMIGVSADSAAHSYSTDLQATLLTHVTDKHLNYRIFCAAAVHQALPWSLLRFAFLGLVGVVSHKVGHPCYSPVHAHGTCMCAIMCKPTSGPATTASLIFLMQSHFARHQQLCCGGLLKSMVKFGCSYTITYAISFC